MTSRDCQAAADAPKGSRRHKGVASSKLRAKVGELAREVDVVLGNLEDAIPTESKRDAREGFIAMARENDFGSTGLWVRVNALNSPWFLDDLTRIVAEVGDKLDVIMIPKVEGPWDIHFIDQFLALLEARHRLKRPILVHAILETARGRQQRRARSPPPRRACTA